MATTRLLCPRCMQSFQPDEPDSEMCPQCDARARLAEGTADLPPELSSPRDSAPRSRGGFLRKQILEAKTWCEGKLWWARAPLWLYLAYTFARHFLGDDPYRSIFDAINLGIHELGHVLFRPLGEFMTFAGGSLTQCLAPMASVWVFHRQRDYFGIAVCFCWLATNLWGVATYCADARALQLPLVAPGMGLMPSGDGSIMHDWNHMLGVTGLLRHDTAIATVFQLASIGSMVIGLVFGGWLMGRMARAPRG